MQLDKQTALLVCAGPSLDGLSDVAWQAIQQAGAVVSVNGSLAARACRNRQVRFTYAAAMDHDTGLCDKVPDFADIWRQTPAWRVAAVGSSAQAEAFVKEVEWWGDAPDEGYVGGSTAMVAGNWLCNPWPTDPNSQRVLESTAQRTGKIVPPRGFRRLAYIGLDMVLGQGGHAAGAGVHASGFSSSPEQYQRVCDGWRYFFRSAEQRGIQVINLTPNTGLRELPHAEVPAGWLAKRDSA